MPSGAQNLQMGSHLRVKANALTNGLAAFTTCPFLYPSSPWPQIPLLCALHSPLQPHGPSLHTLGTLPSRASALVSLSTTLFPRWLHDPQPHPRGSFFKCHLLRKAFPHRPVLGCNLYHFIRTLFPSSLLCLCITYHHVTCYILMCLLP